MLTVRDGNKQDWASMPLKDMAEGNILDSYYTFKLFFKLEALLDEKGMKEHYKNLVSPLIPILTEVEYKGMLVDMSKLKDIAPKMEESVNSKKNKLLAYTQVRPDDNVSSNKVLPEIFFTREDGLGLYPPFMSKKTNQPQLDKNALETLEAMIEEELESRI